MAFSITSTYAGEAAQAFISKALLEGKTLAGGYVTVLPNVKYKMVLPKMDHLANLLQADGCSFNASGNVTLAEKIITVTDVKVNTEVCVTDLETWWTAAKLTSGAQNTDIPSDMQGYMLELMAKKIAAQVETLIWQGSTGGGDLIDGFETVLTADADVVDVVGTTLSAANAIAEFTKVYDAIPATVISQPDLKIFASSAACRFYKQAIAAASNEAYFVGDKKLDFLGIEIVETPGMATNTIVAARTSNLYFGTDLVSDFGEVRIIDMRETDGSDNVRFKARMKAAVAVGYGAEVVLYT